MEPTVARLTEAEVSFMTRQFRMQIRQPQDHQQKRWARGQFYECHPKGAGRPALLRYIWERFGQCGYPIGTVAIDVGASIGNHTVFFAGVMGLQVIAIEPYGPSLDHLAHNLAINDLSGSVTVLGYALGETFGHCHMRRVDSSHAVNNVGMMEAVRDMSGDVFIMRLDDALAELDTGPPAIPFIKIDVEADEAAILRGALGTLDMYKPELFIEVIEASTLDAIDALLKPYGYRRTDNVFNWTPTYHWAVPE